MSKYRIFIDTNVLIGAACFRKGILRDDSDFKAMNYIARRNDVVLYTSSFSVPQLAATLSNTRRNGKKSFTDDEIMAEINGILSKLNIADFGKRDIQKSIGNYKSKQLTKDLEDQLQFDLSQKVGCNFIMTNNLKDFRGFTNVYVFPPKKYSSVIL